MEKRLVFAGCLLVCMALGKTAAQSAGAEPLPEPGSGGPGREIRSIPLPTLSVRNAAPESDYFSEIPDPVPLSPEAARALEDVQKTPREPSPPKRPRAFTRDLEDPAGGEEPGLMRIVQGSFVKRDWRSANDELIRYLSLPRASEVEARARFYLGQACYFSGKYREALIEFLFVQSFYPNEANVWIEAALSGMVE